jgi:hypothetical protein
MLPGIIEFRQKIAHANRQQMELDVCIALDGSWDHHRNVRVHTSDAIDRRSKLQSVPPGHEHLNIGRIKLHSSMTFI